ncbi:MAG: family 43 glycosylhydrolase [Clostridia bacterium]|nr:family 43 glycosylhydrolase [Clostridia bacterium]
MLCGEINIRDPFILNENGRYYLYGTRAASFGRKTGGIDVYISDDLVEWSEPAEVFNSSACGLNTDVNWAPEVHKYNGAYYMFASFTKENGLRGTYILKSDSPMGPFAPHSKGAAVPEEWEVIDGTFYVEDGTPYMVFCHEHTQIIDGTVCYVRLKDNLTGFIGEPVTLFSASSPSWADVNTPDKHCVTDGPFMFRTSGGTLLMIWSTFIGGNYAECAVRFIEGKISGKFEHLDPLLTDDGGHGMIFRANDGSLKFTCHSPNQSGFERVKIMDVADNGDSISIK